MGLWLTQLKGLVSETKQLQHRPAGNKHLTL